MSLSNQSKHSSSWLAAATQLEKQLKFGGFISGFNRLGEAAYSNKEDAQAKNDMLVNVVINEIKNKHFVDCLMAGNLKLIVSDFWIPQNSY